MPLCGLNPRKHCIASWNAPEKPDWDWLGNDKRIWKQQWKSRWVSVADYHGFPPLVHQTSFLGEGSKKKIFQHWMGVCVLGGFSVRYFHQPGSWLACNRDWRGSCCSLCPPGEIFTITHTHSIFTEYIPPFASVILCNLKTVKSQIQGGKYSKIPNDQMFHLIPVTGQWESF